MPTTFIPKITWNTHAGSDILTFADPPVGDPLNEKLGADVEEFKSASGLLSAQRNHLFLEYTVNFQWITSTIKAEVDTFFKNWASYKKPFRYYPDKDVASYKTMYIKDPVLEWGRPLPDGSGDFVYNLKLTLYGVTT